MMLHQVSVQSIEQRDEELMGILLIVPREVVGVIPNREQKVRRDDGYGAVNANGGKILWR